MTQAPSFRLVDLLRILDRVGFLTVLGWLMEWSDVLFIAALIIFSISLSQGGHP